MGSKIFVFGAVNGQLKTAFGKLSSLHDKNHFSLALVTGNLFDAAESDDSDNDEISALLDGRIAVPCPTYFTVGTRPLPARVVERIERDEEVAPNLNFLGKRSITKTSEGVRIVALGGVPDTAAAGTSKEQHLPSHTADDAKALRGAHSADILLTTAWPAAVWRGSRVATPAAAADLPATDAIAELCAALKPRYHLAVSSGDFFYEREPFVHPTQTDDDGSNQVTRFISLAPFGNAAKAKALYAFTLQEVHSSLPPPTGSTPTPFAPPRAPARKRQADEGAYSRFSGGHGRDGGGKRRRQGGRERSPPPGPDRCFFCLSNPNLSTHMVCSIGDECYVATAKGPLPARDTFGKANAGEKTGAGLGFPGHMVIVPLTHAPTVTAAGMGGGEGVDGAEAAKNTFREMSRFREALQAMTSSRTGRGLGAVTFEISRARGIHAHWQFVPVPAAMVRKGLVEAAFRVEAENQGLPAMEAREFGVGDEVGGDYFRAWIWAEQEDEDVEGEEEKSGGRIVGKSLVMRIGEGVRFDLQFGRRVLAKLLGLERRLMWKDVEESQEEETADARAFQSAFKPWDFTMA